MKIAIIFSSSSSLSSLVRLLPVRVVSCILGTNGSCNSNLKLLPLKDQIYSGFRLLIIL
jgi:hypothetical protein